MMRGEKMFEGGIYRLFRLGAVLRWTRLLCW